MSPISATAILAIALLLVHGVCTGISAQMYNQFGSSGLSHYVLAAVSNPAVSTTSILWWNVVAFIFALAFTLYEVSSALQKGSDSSTSLALSTFLFASGAIQLGMGAKAAKLPQSVLDDTDKTCIAFSIIAGSFSMVTFAFKVFVTKKVTEEKP